MLPLINTVPIILKKIVTVKNSEGEVAREVGSSHSFSTAWGSPNSTDLRLADKKSQLIDRVYIIPFSYDVNVGDLIIHDGEWKVITVGNVRFYNRVLVYKVG